MKTVFVVLIAVKMGKAEVAVLDVLPAAADADAVAKTLPATAAGAARAPIAAAMAIVKMGVGPV